MLYDSKISITQVSVQVVGIKVEPKVYSGTDEIVFNYDGVCFIDAVTGREISAELLAEANLSVTVQGRLSDYNVGTQVVLITSIVLSGNLADYRLALSGQQTYAVVEIEQAELTVRVNADGSVSYEGFVNGEDVGALAGELILTREGNVVTPSGLESANYRITYVSGTLEETNGTNSAWLWAVASMSAGVLALGVVLVLRKRRMR